MRDKTRQAWEANRNTHWLTAAWAQGFCELLAALHQPGEDEAIELDARKPSPEAWAAWRNPLWVRFPFGLGDGAELWTGCARDTAFAVGKLVLGTAADKAPDDAVEAYLSVVERSFEAIVDAARSALGKDCSAGAVERSEAPSEPSLGVEFAFPLGGATHLIALCPSPELVTALFPALEAADEPTFTHSTERPTATPRGDEAPAAARLEPAATRNLEILLDVDLDLSVSFGRTRLRLDEIVNLSAGSVVELDRNVSDPVDVLVNNSVVARGEVVVVDGNYGVRITEVSSRRTRLESVL